MIGVKIDKQQIAYRSRLMGMLVAVNPVRRSAVASKLNDNRIIASLAAATFLPALINLIFSAGGPV